MPGGEFLLGTGVDQRDQTVAHAPEQLFSRHRFKVVGKGLTGGRGCSKPSHCNLEDDLAAGGLVFIGLTRLRDRKHRSHAGLEFAGVDQAS